MRGDDAAIYREIEKNAEMGIKAIETLTPKLSDDAFALQLSRQELKYSELRDKARQEMLEGRGETYQANGVSDLMLNGSIQANPLLNTSTSHIAEIMIKEENRGLTSMWKALNHFGNAGNASTELARELMDFEEESIEKLKKYL